MSYNKPPNNNLPFYFGPSGYEPPNFNDVRFQYPNTVRDLRMSITGSELQRDYLKECKTHVIGFNRYNVQILRHSCVYAGIRDLGMQIVSAFTADDLGLYIKPNFTDTANLGAVLKGFASLDADISMLVKTWHVENNLDLPIYLKQAFNSSYDLAAYLHTYQTSTSNLNSMIKGWVTEATTNLLIALKGTTSAQLNLPAYLKPAIADNLDLGLDIHKIWQQNLANLSLLMSGWQTKDLSSYIFSFNYHNLPMVVRCTYLYDLTSKIYAVRPYDLNSSIFGWAENGLNETINIVRSPSDMQFFIRSVPPLNLNMSVQTRVGVAVPFNLPISLSGYFGFNLSSSVNIIAPVDLGAYINATGSSYNLGMRIYPKVVFVRTIIKLSYLEAKDLKLVINSNCFRSDFCNLGMSLNSWHSSNLRFSVFGYDGSNISNLGFKINKQDYITQDSLTVWANKSNRLFTTLPIKVDKFKRVATNDLLGLAVVRTNHTSSVYLKDPGLLAVDSALRFVESQDNINSSITIEEYEIDNKYWSFDWIGIPNGGLNSWTIAFDGDLLSYTYSYSHSSSEDTVGFRIHISPAAVITRVFMKFRPNNYTTAIFDENIVVKIKPLNSANWVEAANLNYKGFNVFEDFVDIPFVDDLIEYVEVTLSNSDAGGLSVFEFIGFSSLEFTGTYNTKHFYDFEDGSVPIDWTFNTMSLAPVSTERGEISLFQTASNAAYTVLASLSPNDIRYGAYLDYYEYYYYKISGVDSPAVKILNTLGDCLIAVSSDSTGALRIFSDAHWITIGDTPLSDTNSWFRVRIDFDWENKLFYITWEDCYAQQTFYFTKPFSEISDRDLCEEGSAFGSSEADSVGYNTSVGFLFNGVFGSSGANACWDSVGIPNYEYFGYVHKKAAVLKRLRLRNSQYINESPVTFEIRAANSKPEIFEEFATLGDVLYSADEYGNSSFWPSANCWKEFDLNNDDNKEYSVWWVVSYKNVGGGTSLFLCEAEMLGETELYNIKSIEIRSHNPNITDLAWSNGWAGANCSFYLDDVYFQKLTYTSVVSNETADLNIALNAQMIPYDLGMAIRVYTDRSYVPTALKERFIVLSLKDNIEQWRKYVSITLDNYANSYYYFSGNKKAYREFPDEHWVIKVKGYSLLDLPAGIERTKLNKKYIFSLNKYESIDAAIKDMTDRVTNVPYRDLNIIVNSTVPHSANLSMYVNTYGRLRHSYRPITFQIKSSYKEASSDLGFNIDIL